MLFRNTFVNVASLVVTLAAGFLTTALLASALGPAAFGLLTLVRAIVGNVGMVESLFGAGITRFVAFHHARDEFERRDALVGTGLLVNLVQGVIISALAIGVSYAAFDRVFGGIPPHLRDLGAPLLAVFFVVFLVQLCALSLSRALEGLQAYPVIRLTEVTVQLLTLALLYLTLRNQSGLPLRQIALVYLAMEVMRLLLFTIGAVRHGLSLRLRRDGAAFRALFAFGKPLAVAKAFTMIGYRGDGILLGIFATVEVIANYQIGNQIWAACVAGLSAFTVALLPAVAERAASGRSSGHVFLTASRYTIALALCLATLSIYAREFVILHWVGAAYTGAGPLVVLFMIQLVVAFHQGISNHVVLGTDRHQPIGKYEGIGAVVNLCISLALVRHLGAVGLLIGGIVKSCIVMPLNTRLALSSLGLPLSAYLREAVMPVWRFLAALVFTTAAISAIGRGLGGGSLSFTLQIAVLCAGMGLLLWMMVLTAEDRRRVSRAITL
jgi:O-antigen/teichoic acid export membrane protein